ncbi:gliding motility-associated C-terminal domain-containing protein [Aequorivita viscosa]|uniref:Gliding motility-associated C-terminal domain-containing protein n=1 Tax=Aequorivita viscosa TaxID=797419 RepID=A0A1M6IER0_9FLAO|nr:gliding motility-associated C-terminal domain-containing protein [Aequorivita viscosa]SDW56776.1 gliding motility-associated C-terminal domain-containing protein [Aequorivita viscosa]SHJ32947.1 gliding motility-associated C-terminal domain-containing protein [Aequorivita viscosa]
MFSLKRLLYIIILFIYNVALSQDISLYQQFNGHYDYIDFGNTLNIAENGSNSDCTILTTSGAYFNLEPQQEIVAAYLYWAGSGPGDFEISFNQVPLSAERTFNLLYTQGDTEYSFFSGFADVTDEMRSIGNGYYAVSELDLTTVIPDYCASGLNFGGWAVTVIYEDPSLPLNQVNVFDGLESVNRNNVTLEITIDNLLVLETEGAKIGFLAWEGDREISVNESLRINGNILSNPPLNPTDNAFNGTNSFTGSDTLHNMDIDFYSISNYVNTGDTSANIQLTSGQDFVMINNIITVLNTELPDATISVDTILGAMECGNRELSIDYTVYNINSTAILPSGTPIVFYADETRIAQTATIADIPINGEETGSIVFTVPNSVGEDFILKAVVDDTGNGTGIVSESNENNNEDEIPIILFLNPVIAGIQDLETCDVIGIEYFDLTEATSEIDPIYELSFHLTQDDAENNLNPIPNPENFQNTENPQTIFIRVANPYCFLTESFTVTVNTCPLPDATIDFPEITACRDRALLLPFTVYNLEATGPLPANTSIAFYADDVPLGRSFTRNSIPIGGSESNEVELLLPNDLLDTFVLTAVVDDDLNGNGTVEELREDNNSFSGSISFESIPPIPNLPNLLKCDEGFNTATFDLSVQDDLIRNGLDGTVQYFTTLEDAITNSNAIGTPIAYQNGANLQIIYVRLENEICFATTSFLIQTEKCAPFIPQGFSPNGDGINDVFEISNLLNIYENFELEIYSRNGNLIHSGRNQDGFWDGIATKGLIFKGNLVPVGTYYYVLFLNDPKYPEPFISWIYINY